MGQGRTLTNLINTAIDLAVAAVPVVAALALLFFIWGIADFIFHADDTEKRKKAQQKLIWGLISMIVIVSLAGLVQILNVTVFSSESISGGSASGFTPSGTSGNTAPSGSTGSAVPPPFVDDIQGAEIPWWER